MRRRRIKIPAGQADAPKPANPFDTDFAEIVGLVLGGHGIEEAGTGETFWGFKMNAKVFLKLARARMMADLPRDADQRPG
jgi:hypothetical protein